MAGSTIQSNNQKPYDVTPISAATRQKVRRLVELIDKKAKPDPSARKPSGDAVKVHPLARSVAISKDYGPYEMVFSDYAPGGEFRKHPKMVSGHEIPSEDEIRDFKADLAEAAKTDDDVRMFLANHPELILSG